jgi:hypothetical protein
MKVAKQSEKRKTREERLPTTSARCQPNVFFRLVSLLS